MNSITLTGRLTADPEVKSANSDPAITQFRMAVPRRRSRDGENRGAVFVSVACFGKLAENVGEYLSKGRQVAVAGRLELDEWDAEDGGRRQRHKVIADAVEFLGPRPANGDQQEEGS